MVKKRKKKDKIREKIKKQKKLNQKTQQKTVRFKCLKCGAEEEIPRDVVEMLDFQDAGDLIVPPRFECQLCDGLMEPMYYVSVHGITYEMKEKK